MLENTGIIGTINAVFSCFQSSRNENFCGKALGCLYFIKTGTIRRMHDKMFIIADFESAGSRNARDTGSRIQYGFNNPADKFLIDKTSGGIMNQNDIIISGGKHAYTV